MHVFVTGMGSALIPKLLSAGHTVSGLARSDSSAAKVTSLGATPVKGDLTDLSAISAAAAQADAVVHLGFDHGQAFSGDMVGACSKDKAVIGAIGDALTSSGGSGKTLLFAAGVLGLQGDDEKAEPHRSEHMPRYQSSDAAVSYVPKGLRVVELRLAPVTYNLDRPHDFIGMWIGESIKAGYVPYLDGSAWAACTYEEAANGMVAAIAKRDDLPNPVNLHLVRDNGVPLKDIAETLSNKLGKPAKAVGQADLGQFGFLGSLMMFGKPVKADYTYRVTGWTPKDQGLLRALDGYTYA